MKSKTKKIMLAFAVLALVAAVAFISSTLAYRAKKTKVIYDVVDNTPHTAEDSQNILFLGTDRQAGLCDVIMLINVNFDAKRITVAHVPRDTYAKYTDSSYKKLNGAYNSLGGAAQTAEFLENALGTEIDHYICVGLDTVGDIVDAIGGVEVNLPCDMKYSDSSAGLYIDLKKGSVCLDGELAEDFLRYRSGYADGDLGRIDAQKLFMSCFFDKLANELTPIMTAKLCAAAENVETDLQIDEWLTFGTKALSLFNEQIYFLTLPGEEVIATKSGASYYCLSAPSTEEIVKLYFGAKDAFDTNQVFLNDNYNSFSTVYKAQKEYSISSVDEILEEARNN